MSSSSYTPNYFMDLGLGARAQSCCNRKGPNTFVHMVEKASTIRSEINNKQTNKTNHKNILLKDKADITDKIVFTCRAAFLTSLM